MKKKSGLVLRIILGMYLVFLGGSLLMEMVKMKPSDYMLKSFLAVIFILVGIGYAFHNIKAIYKMVNEETEETQGSHPEETAADEVRFEKPQHDKTMFRTAPMPSEEEIQKELQENTQKTVEIAKKEMTEPSAEEKKKDSNDPVSLAIEIMQKEDADRTKTEEIENDYEEK